MGTLELVSLDVPTTDALIFHSCPNPMSDDSPRRRVNLHDLNWLGKSVFLGGTALRLTANLIESTADRVSTIAAQSKEAFDRELDPNIEDARVIEEYPNSPDASDA